MLLAVVLAFGMSHAAYAGTASVATINTSYKYQSTDSSLVFRAAPGERNRIVVSRAAAGGSQASVLRDEGAPVSAGPGCTAIDERTVSCGAWYIDIDAGDGDDTVTLPSDVAGRAGYVRGGPGSDVLSGGGFLAGGPGDDVLTCPAGACDAGVLAGGGGDDLLRGGNGDDVLSGDGDGPPEMIVYDTVITESAGVGSDIIGGGLGRDQLTFRGRRASATIDLAAGRAGGAGGERDSLAGIENAAGGDGDDLLVGDARDNVLEGDAGDDRIDGRAGNDYLLGNLIPDTNEFGLGYTPPDPGADTLRGSAGDDRLDAGSERGDVLSGGAGDDTLQDELNSSAGTHARRVRCGSGRDTIDFAPRGQLVSDCELLRPTYSRARIALRPLLRGRGRLRFTWTCLHDDGCAMALGVRMRSSPLARRAVSTRGPTRHAFLMRPRRAARRGDIADIIIIIPTGNAPPYAARWRVTL